MTRSRSIAWSRLLPALITAQTEFVRAIRLDADAEFGPRFILPSEDLAPLVSPGDPNSIALAQSVVLRTGEALDALIVCAVIGVRCGDEFVAGLRADGALNKSESE